MFSIKVKSARSPDQSIIAPSAASNPSIVKTLRDDRAFGIDKAPRVRVKRSRLTLGQTERPQLPSLVAEHWASAIADRDITTES